MFVRKWQKIQTLLWETVSLGGERNIGFVMSKKLSLTAAAHSEIGPKEENQDSYNYVFCSGDQLAFKGMLGVIADGVSASENGGEAARIAVRSFIEDYYSTPDSWSVEKSAQKVISALNSALYRQGQGSISEIEGLVTTFSVVVFKSTTAHIFHIGDSRIYRLRDGLMEQLTRDHSASLGRGRTYLARALGMDMQLKVDYLATNLEMDDRYILTTDGVHDFIPHEQLQYLAGQKEPLEQIAQSMVSVALNQYESRDNLTALLLDVECLPEETKNEAYQKLAELPFPPDMEPGTRIDGFKILQILSESQRGQVYLAEDMDSGKKLVLKTPSVNYEDEPVYLNGFVQEEWVGRRINHPGVLRTYDSGRRKKFLYFTSEYIDGQNLRQWMSDNPNADLSKIRPIVDQIIAALHALHRQDMIHQDLKPENIMIDSEGRVTIIDFGSTKVAGIAEISSVVNTSHPMGTLNYTAPEYLIGERGSSRSDIFSLGVIVYEMLSGELPYKERRGFNLRSYSHMQYIPLKTRRPDIPDWLDSALKEAVQPNPSNRFALLSEFQHDYRTPREIGADGPRPLIERNPVAVWQGVSAVLLMALIASLFYCGGN